MKDLIFLVLICAFVIFAVVLFARPKVSRKTDVTNFDANNFFVENDPNTEIAYLEISLDANNIEDAAQALRNSCGYFAALDASSGTDFRVIIDDEIHETSFEEFFRWMGFED